MSASKITSPAKTSKSTVCARLYRTPRLRRAVASWTDVLAPLPTLSRQSPPSSKHHALSPADSASLVNDAVSTHERRGGHSTLPPDPPSPCSQRETPSAIKAPPAAVGRASQAVRAHAPIMRHKIAVATNISK